MRLIVDNKPIEYENDDSILLAMLRSGEHPMGGGCLCLGGDCMHCLATVDGVSYVRTCQTKAKPGQVVETHHYGNAYPPLPEEDRLGAEVHAHNLHCDVVVIGAGESGQAEAAQAEANGKSVITLDAGQGQEALGVYAGPLVVARSAEKMLHIHVKEQVIVATGAAEIQPVAPGTELEGLVTARAATQLANAGVDLGRIIAIGTPPENIDAQAVAGRVTHINGDGKVSSVTVADNDGNETTYECDTVSFGLGFHPRDALARQGHDMPEVRAVGEAALESDIPPCPLAGTVCACSAVTVKDLQYTWDSGFRELELIKRSTLAGTGTCQGSACMPHLRSFIADRGKELQKPFTARPLTRQVTIGEIAAGAHHHATARTALDGEHRKLGAQMERSGGWWRPWTYGNLLEEYWAVREAVSIMDVSTLGKMTLQGPDALNFLERLYPTQVRTIRKGRSRYVLLLDERGYAFDDGMIVKEDENKYTLTFTSGGSSHAEMWVRDWAHGMGMDVRIMHETQSLGAINVTGPLAAKLLERVTDEKLPKFLRFKDMQVAGVDCKVFRLSFTGELSYELHHSAENSTHLWRTLLKLGQDLGIKPHGLEALTLLRLEKGHIIIGQDSDFDSTPRRLHHEWMCNLKKKEDFLGKTAVIRTNKIELDKQLVGIEQDANVGYEGAVIWRKDANGNDEFGGHVTSFGYSPVLGKAVMLGWLYLVDGELPTDMIIAGEPARRVPTPFYDKEASRARA
ncbi:MAG: 2Fe-2S iron-sulfur cluster-binding protein [Candidatus Promineifilaceae bacterium]